MCCICKSTWWKRKSPLFYSLLIPLTLILLFVYFCLQHSWLLLPLAVCFIGLWWLLVYSLFPRIVVTIKSIKDIKEFKDPDQFQSLKLYIDGKSSKITLTSSQTISIPSGVGAHKVEIRADRQVLLRVFPGIPVFPWYSQPIACKTLPNPFLAERPRVVDQQFYYL